jgi:type I restriction enzyme S subunit
MSKPQFKYSAAGPIPLDWITVQLKDVCTKIGSGITPRGGEKVYREKGIALIRSQNVLNNRFSFDGLVYIDESMAKEMENVEVQRQDILLNITGDSVGRCCTVPEEVLPARVNQHVSIIRVNRQQVNPVFLRYYLTSPKMQEYMLSLAQSGGTRNALTKGLIEDFISPQPDISEQEAIADILSKLDMKIALNERMNRTLEAVGAALFRRWFVDFEFPNQDGKPYRSTGGKMQDSDMGKIPEGWRTDKLGNHTIIKGRIGWKGLQVSEYVPAGPRIVGGMQLIGGRVNWDACPCIPKFRYDESPEIMLKQNDILLTKDGTIGKLAFVDELIEPATVASGIFVIRSNSGLITQMYLLSYFKSSIFGNLVESRIEGSVVPHLYQRDITELPIVVPSAEIANRFQKIATSLQRKIDSNSRNSVTLGKIRDALLPKLMSGKIRVPLNKEN